MGLSSLLVKSLTDDRDMRAAMFIGIAVLLLAGAWFFTVWPFSTDQNRAPAGMYPLHAKRWQWPVKTEVASYSPGSNMGTDAVPRSDALDIKQKCATDKTCV
jgi:hypothetical protein